MHLSVLNFHQFCSSEPSSDDSLPLCLWASHQRWHCVVLGPPSHAQRLFSSSPSFVALMELPDVHLHILVEGESRALARIRAGASKERKRARGLWERPRGAILARMERRSDLKEFLSLIGFSHRINVAPDGMGARCGTGVWLHFKFGLFDIYTVKLVNGV